MNPITLTLDANEQNALQQLFDVALRQSGLSALPLVSHFVTRVTAAQSAAAGAAPPTAVAANASVQQAVTNTKAAASPSQQAPHS